MRDPWAKTMIPVFNTPPPTTIMPRLPRSRRCQRTGRAESPLRVLVQSLAGAAVSCRFMSKITVTFGEVMLRLAPPGMERFLQTPQFVATFGGGEANVAVALANLGMPAAYVTVLPDAHPVAE